MAKKNTKKNGLAGKIKTAISKAKGKKAEKTTSKTVTTTTTVTKTTTTTVDPKLLKNRIAIVLDRSSSMGSVREETVRAFNAQVEAIRANAKEMDTKVSLFTFSDVADEPTIWNQDVRALLPLALANYVPNGMTAMFDGVGKAASALECLPEATDLNASFLLIVISDGGENHSHVWNQGALAEKLKALQATNRWTITYVGANQDLTKISQTLHIPIGNTMVYAATNAGTFAMSAAGASASSKFMKSRAGGQSASVNFYAPQPDSNQGAAKVTAGTAVDTKVTVGPKKTKAASGQGQSSS